MRGNRRVDTKPEIQLRRGLHAQGLRFRKDHRVESDAGVGAKADIVFPCRRVVVFVDGCFWHGCPEHCRIPTRNREYWVAKISRNRLRDNRVTTALRSSGWQVIRIWEHEPLEQALTTVGWALSGDGTTVDS